MARLERVVGHAHVDEPGGHVGHRLEREELGHHPADLVLHELEVGEAAIELAALGHVGDRAVEQPLGAASRPRGQRHAPVVEDVHGDLEAVPGFAEHVLGRHAPVAEVQMAQVVGPQAHSVVAVADLEALHPHLEDERDMAVLAADLGRREGHEDRALVAVADPPLLAVEQPRPVGLAHGA